MKSVETWFDEYGDSHHDKTNKLIHWLCVPTILFCTVGFIWIIPKPGVMGASPFLNWATVALVLAVAYYAMLSVPLALGMLVVNAAVFGILYSLSNVGIVLWQVCLSLFVIAWIVQFIGHKIEGKKPSFFKDMQFLLIGPIWLLGFLYKRLGIRY